MDCWKIRKKEYKDCISVVKIITKTWQQTYEGIMDEKYLNELSYNENERILNAQRSFKNETDQEFVLELDGIVIGFIRVGKSSYDDLKSVGEIFALYLIEEYKNRGFGKKLFLKGVSYLKENGYENIIVGCIKENLSNQFYKHMGGKIIGERKYERAGKKFIENIYLI